MVPVWVTLRTSVGETPPSPEVVRQCVLAVSATLDVRIEHVWIDARPGIFQVVAFLLQSERVIAGQIGSMIGRAVAQQVSSLHFVGSRAVGMRDLHD